MCLIVRNHEEAEVRWELNREQMTTNRAAEIEKETEQRREESQLRMERLRQEREQDEELLRAMNAMKHAEIIPLVTEEERTFREEVLAPRNRVGVPRTHRVACKVLASEDHLAMHDCGEMNVTYGECNARHFKEPIFLRHQGVELIASGSTVKFTTALHLSAPTRPIPTDKPIPHLISPCY
ncbi:hypothetical protein OUZ56_003460 [Daphnia magna]|uniref:Uncharacterized protein n=1 Tax=Daphnia magna TaxID=35525 RepID=A0ABR0A8V3_9CRUS|nr:hypothetical protein OUZ56_003460 [Daphnia magna]